jgi:hypothetical protein
MNLNQCRKLEVGSKFRKPSTNGHDNGWREYYVVLVEVENDRVLAFTAEDQHGYRLRVRLAEWKQGTKEYMQPMQLI